MAEFLDQHDPQTSAIIGAAIEVHKTLGHGFLENVYHHALCSELQRRDISYLKEVPLAIHYKDEVLACSYKADILAFDRVLVEVKAQSGLTEVDEAQVINYLRATELERALLLNFGRSRMQIRRIILTEEYKRRDHQESPEIVRLEVKDVDQ